MSGPGSVWSLRQLLHIQHFLATASSLNQTINQFVTKPFRWHTCCCYCNRLLLAQSRARSRSNLNQHDHFRFSETSQERFEHATILPTDQSHRDRFQNTMPDHLRCGSSFYDVALSDRMRQWQRRWPGVDPSRHRNHRVSHMGSCYRLLSHFLFRSLWSAITRSPG